MATNPDPGQGSLFDDSQEIELDKKPCKSNSVETSKELSDTELAKDAELRPRKRKHVRLNTREKVSPTSKQKAFNDDSDLPPWSHHELVEINQLTPVLRHYVELKAANPERILLYRLGDFFECFFEDAIKLSRILELTLTGKEGGKAIGRVPMAGIPHHAAEKYCSELLRKGLSVAICDQLETTPIKGSLIKREITRVLTPGTVLEEGMLHARRNNWLAALVIDQTREDDSFYWGLASADVSTGEFFVMEREGKTSLLQELSKLEASEIIYSPSQLNAPNEWCPERVHLTEIPITPFNKNEAEFTLRNHFELTTLNGIGLQDLPLALRAAGGLLSYLNDTNPTNEETLSFTKSAKIPLDIPRIIFQKDFLIIDAQTQRNLEITSTQRDNQFQGSLLWALDRTLTSMGGRCLRSWLERPLMNVEDILARQKIITELVSSRDLRQSIRRLLRSMGDLERLAGRAGAGQASARDLMAIANGLERLPQLSTKLKTISVQGPDWLKSLINLDLKLLEISSIIHENVVDSPPLNLNEGGLINDGVDQVLDGLRNQLDDQDAWLESQEILERKLSGITNLRLQYHRTFGYFLAVSKAKAQTVPDHWIRRQTLSNEERFITPELKSREGKIFQAKARAAEREYEIFCKLRARIGKQANLIRQAARSIAGVDALAGLAEVAATHSYCPPKLLTSDNREVSRKIKIEACRHPVVEQILVEESFKPNDVQLGSNTDLIILTGPNASGKSCYLRQIGLIQLIAQIGSWVPAKKASLSIADRIFTRVGAVDDLAAGQSTFMVEMTETAYILHQATSLSLVLLDEIGRGTATYDGLSIAWSVSEFLAKEIKSRTIFATHYHELNELSETLANVANFQVLVKETGKDLHFLHQVVPGGASRSYGIEAARLSGVPTPVVQRAHQILNQLQTRGLSPNKDLNSSEKKAIPSAA